MEGKRVRDSSVNISHLMMPQDANPAGNVHGGVVIKNIDSVAGVVATRHARSNTVTASIDRLDFHSPVFIGNLLTLKASVNIVGRTSMEIGVRVEREHAKTGERSLCADARATFVNLGDDGKPCPVPRLLAETEEDRQLAAEAEVRRAARRSR